MEFGPGEVFFPDEYLAASALRERVALRCSISPLYEVASDTAPYVIPLGSTAGAAE
jgi:hypothetical protein